MTEPTSAESPSSVADARFRALVEAVGEVVFETDADGRWTTLSPAWSAITGHAVPATVGRHVAGFIHPDDLDASLAAFRPLLAEGATASEHELRCLAADGGTRWLRVRARAALGPDGRATGTYGTLTDVTAERALRERLARLERHDALTGLANRVAFVERVAHAAARRDGGARPAVLLVDLDDFRAVNADVGHAVGDRVLAVVADRLLQVTLAAGFVARLDGDAFAVLVHGPVSADDVGLLGERIITALAVPYAVAGAPIRLTVGVGVALADAGATADAVLRQAELALQGAKAAGRGRLAWFSDAVDAEARDRLALAAGLRVAIARDELHLAFQPIVALATGRPSGVEALVRWRHPERGAVSPATFIPIAEEIGLIPELGRWVLREACATMARLAVGTAGEACSVSVNVSGRQLEDERFADDVADALATTGLAPERLVLEVTETALVREAGRARRVLGELRALGVRVAIDDFGTGYSSLSYLQQLPMDVLKIDRSFVADVTSARGGPSLAFARTIVALGQALGLRTVAEGIETAVQREALRAVGCSHGQGYLFARPLPAAELGPWLAAHAEGWGAGTATPSDAR